MNKPVVFIKTNGWLLSAVVLCAFILGLAALNTNMFTTLPDFEGSFKAIMADILMFPALIGVFVLLFSNLRLPERIELDLELSEITVGETKLARPVDVTLQRKLKLYRFIVASQGKQVLNTGYLYKMIEGEIKSSTATSGKYQVSFSDK